MGDEEKQSKIETGNEEDVNTSDGSLDLGHNDSVTGSVVDTLRERVKELEALVGGKEEALHVALQGLDSAMGVEVEYRAQLEGCRARVGEFQQAVQHRDQLIEQLSASLEHTLRARDELAQDGERLAQEVSLLRSQLQATSELVAQGSSKSQHDFMLLQNRMLALEDTSKKKDARIEELQRLLSEEQGAKKELEQKKGELTQYKSQTATHVQQLMQEVERLHREAVNSKTLERQRAQQVMGLEREHQRQLAELRAELEEQFGQQLMQIQENHRIQFSEQVLKQQQSEEVASASVTTTTSSNDSDTQQQLQELSERALQVASEREDLLSQLALYKGQVQSLSEELLKYSSEANDSQQSLRVSLESENVSLKEQLHSLKERLRAVEEDKIQELGMYRQAQVSEVATWRKRVDSLTLELQKVSEVAESYLLRLEECTKVHETEITSLQEAHAKELAFLSGQVEGVKQFKVEVARLQEKLQEQTVMEKRLQNELETSIRAEEELKGRLLEIQEERQVLRSAFEQQKELLHQQANNVEKLKTELQEKERCELSLREELKVLTDKITSAREGDAKLYKEQIDKLNEQLQQKVKTEELLKKQVLEREEIEQVLKQELEEQTNKYKSQLSSVKQMLQEKVKIEDQLRTELQEKVREGELLQNELKTLKYTLEELKKSTGEAEVYKTQVDSLNRQLQERSQSEHKIISDYESRVKALTFDLNTIESRLSSEVQDIQARAREELLNKQETERRLEGELEAVRNELLALKTLPDVQEYKEQINKLNLLVQEKQKTEGALKAELQAVSAEVAALKENQQHLENLNSDLEERLRTEQRLQEELIAAAKMHKEQVDVLSAKINELTSQQNSLDNEAISMRQEIQSQKSYIHDLELIREQVSQSAKTKEVLINDLSVCVKSLTEDNASYQQKLDHLNKRLDDECHRADENMVLREGYEKEISKHKQHIEELKNSLQEALKTRDLHLVEISGCQQELKGYKEQLETLNNTFEEETSRLRQEYVEKMDEKTKRAEELGKELVDVRKEASSYKQQMEKLNEIAIEKEKAEIINKKQMAELNKELLEVKNKLEEKKNQIEELQTKLTHVEDCQSKDITMFTNKIKDLEAEIAVKTEHIGKLNVQMEESACKFDDVNKLLLQAQQQFAQERENNARVLWDRVSTEAKSQEKPEDQAVEVEQMQNASAIQPGLQELNIAQEKSPKDRDSLNFSSISETELLQLESKLQHALNEKNDIEKSFKDHINKLAENHQKEVNLYEEQLQAVHKKLEELMKTHSECESEKESLKTEVDKLLIDHEKTSSYKDKLKITFEKLEELSQVHKSCHSEQEALKSLITGLEKDQKEKDDLLVEAGRKYEELSRAHGGCISEKEKFTAHINKLSARYENEITEYVQQLKEASEKIDELSRSNADCLVENGSLKGSVTKMTEICEEVTLYKDQLRITNERLEEISKIHAECVSVKDSFVRKVSEQEMTLQDQESVLQKKSEAIDACQKDLAQTREYIELLKVNLQDEISKVRVELRNLVNICAPNNETLNEEDNKQKSSEESSFMNGKDDWSPDWSQKEGHGSLEQSFVSAATIHHDVSALRGHVERLVSDLHSIKQKSSATEGLLAAKEENEIILKKRIDNLQKELGIIDEEKKNFKEQLEELTVKFLTAQSLLAGKTEAESSLQKEVGEMEVGTCNKCKNLEEEISHLNSKLLDNEEKLRNIERERDKIVNKYKQSEKDKEKLREEKADLANAIEQLKTEHSHATNVESEGSLNMSENSRNNQVLQYNALLDEHRNLLAEKSRVEELLEQTKAELIRVREQQIEISSTAGEMRHEGMGVEKGTQEQLDSVKEEAACVQLREYSVSSSNLSTSLDFFVDLGVRGLEESDAADVAPVHATGDAASSLKPNRSLHAVVLKLMQHCAVLDAAKRTLASECDALRGRLEEREAQELLFNEELAAANSRCEALEQRLQEARQQEPTREALAGAKMALQCELRALEGENSALKAAKVSLQDELLSLRKELQHLKKMVGSRNADPKGLAQELAVKVTEAAILQEKLKVTERESETLQAHVEALEKTKQDMLKQFETFLEEARRTREQLEAAWQEQADAEEQLGRTRCELAIAGLRRESKVSGLDSSAVPLLDTGDSPVFHLHQEVHTMVEEMAQELVSLRRELQSERTRNEHMVLERSGTEEPLEMKQKLEALMKSNLELLQEKQTLLDQLQKQQGQTHSQSSTSQEAPVSEVDLLAQLSVYREQHVSLAEAIGSTGALQEALRQQKEELLALVQAKGSVEAQLATERAEAQSSRLRLQLLEQQLQEKDLLHQELFQQKCNLQAELQQLEDKLREREQMLQIQRVQLQAELRAQEMRLRRWQLQQRASEVERKLDESLREVPGLEEAQKEVDTSATELEGHLQMLREEMHRAHREAVARLKQHLDAEFSVREQALRAGFSAEMASAQATHREQLAKLQHALLSAEKELERLRNADLARTLGNAGHMSTELSTAKERYEQELQTICSGLDEGQAHLFAVLKHLFEEFARQLVAGTTTLLQSQNEQLVEREVATLTSHHQQQLECLRATLEKEHFKTLKELEEEHSALLTENNEEVATKLLLNVSTAVQLHSADSSQVALVQLKHLLYSEYTSALREVTKDWALAWKEEVSSQLEALEKALEEEATALQLLRDSPESQGSGTCSTATSKPLEELLQDAEKLTTRAEGEFRNLAT